MLKDSLKVLRKELKSILAGYYNTEPSKLKGNGTTGWSSSSKDSSFIFSVKFILEWFSTENFKLWTEKLALSQGEIASFLDAMMCSFCERRIEFCYDDQSL